MGGVTTRNLRMFRKLCGTESLKNVVVVMTRWDEIDKVKGTERERELLDSPNCFQPLLEAGGRSVRHDNTPESARRIMELLLEKDPVALQIQVELAEGTKIENTEAGNELRAEMNAFIAKHQKEMQTLQEELRTAVETKDRELEDELKAESQKLGREIEKFNHQKIILEGSLDSVREFYSSELAKRKKEERRTSSTSALEHEEKLILEVKIEQLLRDMDGEKRKVRESERRCQELTTKLQQAGLQTDTALHDLQQRLVDEADRASSAEASIQKLTERGLESRAEMEKQKAAFIEMEDTYSKEKAKVGALESVLEKEKRLRAKSESNAEQERSNFEELLNRQKRQVAAEKKESERRHQELAAQLKQIALEKEAADRDWRQRLDDETSRAESAEASVGRLEDQSSTLRKGIQEQRAEFERLEVTYEDEKVKVNTLKLALTTEKRIRATSESDARQERKDFEEQLETRKRHAAVEKRESERKHRELSSQLEQLKSETDMARRTGQQRLDDEIKRAQFAEDSVRRLEEQSVTLRAEMQGQKVDFERLKVTYEDERVKADSLGSTLERERQLRENLDADAERERVDLLTKLEGYRLRVESERKEWERRYQGLARELQKTRNGWESAEHGWKQRLDEEKAQAVLAVKDAATRKLDELVRRMERQRVTINELDAACAKEKAKVNSVEETLLGEKSLRLTFETKTKEERRKLQEQLDEQKRQITTVKRDWELEREELEKKLHQSGKDREVAERQWQRQFDEENRRAAFELKEAVRRHEEESHAFRAEIEKGKEDLRKLDATRSEDVKRIESYLVEERTARSTLEVRVQEERGDFEKQLKQVKIQGAAEREELVRRFGSTGPQLSLQVQRRPDAMIA